MPMKACVLCGDPHDNTYTCDECWHEVEAAYTAATGDDEGGCDGGFAEEYLAQRAGKPHTKPSKYIRCTVDGCWPHNL